VGCGHVQALDWEMRWAVWWMERRLCWLLSTKHGVLISYSSIMACSKGICDGFLIRWRAVVVGG